MDLIEGLTGRRSVYEFTEQVPDLDVVRQALDAAVCAPNHHKTKPWRFFVFTGDGRAGLAEAYGVAAARLGRPVDLARRKAFTSPVLVLAGVRPMLAHPKVVHEEEVLAVGVAIQNVMLALHARGVGSKWTSGALVDSDEVKALVGMTEPNDHIVGGIYIGYPNGDKAIRDREPATHESVTTWFA